MARGGRQPGAGRPKGARSRVTAKAKLAAMETGLLPHEWLLKVSRGEGITHCRWEATYDEDGEETSRMLIEEEVYVDFTTRLDAAKVAAPFYAPKLTVQAVSVSNNSDAVASVLKDLAAKLPV